MKKTIIYAAVITIMIPALWSYADRTVRSSGRVTDPEILGRSFERILGPHGSWVYTHEYGRVWQPAVARIDRTWRPYCTAGKWISTSRGPYWESDYAWGDVAFHYGRWAKSARYNWTWVPGTTWSSAWVNWTDTALTHRWAPLPPEAEYSTGLGFSYNGREVSIGFHFGLTDWHYVSVPAGYLTVNRLASIVVVPRNRTSPSTVYQSTCQPSTVVYTAPVYTYSYRSSYSYNRQKDRHDYRTKHYKRNQHRTKTHNSRTAPVVKRQTRTADRVKITRPSTRSTKTVYRTPSRPVRTEQKVVKTTYKQPATTTSTRSSRSSSRSDRLRNIALNKLR